SPIAMVVGLLRDADRRPSSAFRRAGEPVFVVGTTRAELGGSEYCETVLKARGGVVPAPEAREDSRTYRAILSLIRSGAADAVHDCSKGGLAIAMAEMCIQDGVGAAVDAGRIPGGPLSPTEALFSESHGRFVLSAREGSKAEALLRREGISYSLVGETGGDALRISAGGKTVASLEVDAIRDIWERPLARLMG